MGASVASLFRVASRPGANVTAISSFTIFDKPPLYGIFPAVEDEGRSVDDVAIFKGIIPVSELAGFLCSSFIILFAILGIFSMVELLRLLACAMAACVFLIILSLCP
ncbi:hypothetical protein [Adlercreutzia sp. ZJ242]|uniref:hypothetical protein n=1 Tax=Adlercreutzia sp. ZJ242 TaxID=2709409 RepID=UPI001980C24D|nr:hypothetical protein [Adlercreutzia sp. ZJ242]